MKGERSRSMLVTYQRSNQDLGEFILEEWKSYGADVLSVAQLLDYLPSRLSFRYSNWSRKNIVCNSRFEEAHFLALIPGATLDEFEVVPINPFLPSSGLQGLNVRYMLNWKKLVFKFEFPTVQTQPISTKAVERW
jgi:hypothetical protein